MTIKALAEVDSATNTLKNGVKVTSAQISDATTTGKAVLTAATAVAARTAIGAPDANATPTKATTISSLAVSGTTLTATKADGTTQAVALPTTSTSGTGGGGTELVHQSATGSWPAARPTAVSVIAAGISTRPNDPPGWLTDADIYLDLSGQGTSTGGTGTTTIDQPNLFGAL